MDMFCSLLTRYDHIHVTTSPIIAYSVASRCKNISWSFSFSCSFSLLLEGGQILFSISSRIDLPNIVLFSISYDSRCFITVLCTLNTQDNKNQLTRTFADGCQLHQLRHPNDVVWDAVRDGEYEAPPLLGLSAFTFFLMMLSHTGGKLYLPLSLLRLGLRALMYMASFTPLSNHLGSVVNTSVFSNSTECWG